MNASVDCPNNKINLIIGKKGSAIHALTEKSGCRILIDPDNSQDPRKLHLSGTPEGLAIAMSLISRVLEEGPSFLVPDVHESLKEEVIVDNGQILCPKSKVGALIGNKGSVISDIIKKSGCKIQIVQEGTKEDGDRPIVFTGTSSQISEAKRLVLQILRGDQTQTIIVPSPIALLSTGSIEKTSTVIKEYDILPQKVGSIIGSKGAVLNDIMKRSGCKIHVNQKFPEGENHKVVLNGTDSQIDYAISIIEAIIEHGPQYLQSMPLPLSNTKPDVVTQELTLFQSQVQKLYGHQGSLLQDIQTRYQVRLSFEYLPSLIGLNIDQINKVTITGKETDVDSVVKLIHQILGISSQPQPQQISNYQSNQINSLQSVVVPQLPLPDLTPKSSKITYALGSDGSAGYLESSVQMTDGSHNQIAEIKNEYYTRYLGNSVLSLIRSKSGANIFTIQNNNEPLRVGYTRLTIIGSLAAVTTASQMIQEVLVYGIGKLQLMPDVQPTYNISTSLPPYAQY
eukprot:gene17139-22653_t